MRVKVRLRVRVSRVTESANALPRYLVTSSPTLGDSAGTHGKHSTIPSPGILSDLVGWSDLTRSYGIRHRICGPGYSLVVIYWNEGTSPL